MPPPHPSPKGLISQRIDARDFEMLPADGYSDQWNFNRVGQGYGYVRCKNGNVKGGCPPLPVLFLAPVRNRWSITAMVTV